MAGRSPRAMDRLAVKRFDAMKLLVINVGSTSLKAKLFAMPEETLLCAAAAERVGSADGAKFFYRNILSGKELRREGLCIPDHARAIDMLMEAMTDRTLGLVADAEDIGGVGFKTVLSKGHYGVQRLTDDVIQGMRDSLFLAPAHNAPYLEAIERFSKQLPGVPLVGVFETAFHAGIPLFRRLYAVPYEWYERYGISKLGYHGASHSYVAEEAARLGRAERVICCHLGGSSSVCAIEAGRSVDTSFGFSLQTGLPHANRTGDADAYLIPFLLHEGLPMEEILDGMGKRGGLLGLSGVSGDLRDIQQAADAGNARAALAIQVFVCWIVRYIGMFYAELGGLDQLVFTGGIGEHASSVRAQVCQAVRHMGVMLDPGKNAASRGGIISAPDSPVLVSVIPANEELGVARQTYRCMTGAEMGEGT